MNKYGMVMLHSHEHPQSILVNRGYLFCCGVAIRAIKEGRIDVGLAHIYSQQDDVDDVLLKITHSLEEDDYKILEYVVSYARDEIEQHLKGRTYSQYEEDIQYHFPGIKIAFVSRNSENEKDDLAVDQQGVAIKRFSVNPSGAFSRDIHLVDWHRSTQTSATSNPAMRLNNAPGGIDLTPKRMGLDIASDKAMKAEPLNLKALEDMTINGLYIKDIAIKPLDNLPQLLEMTSH